MRTNEFSVSEVLNGHALLDKGYRYGWIQSISSVQIGDIDSLDINSESLLEARFFNEEKEMHIFNYNDSLKAIETVLEKCDHAIEEKQILRKKYGKTVTLRNFIDFDPDDGQAFVCRTVLCGYER